MPSNEFRTLKRKEQEGREEKREREKQGEKRGGPNREERERAHLEKQF